MPMEEVKFEFPDPDRPGEKVEVEGNPRETPVAGTAGESDDFEVEGDADIEVIDDTPEPDKGRKPADEPPEAVSDEELQSYSDKIRKRIQHLGRGYHDERRAKEEALRQRDELENYARAITGKLKEMETTTGKSREMLLNQAKQNAALEHERAKKEYKNAYESGDSDALLEAQEKLTNATIKLDRVTNFKLPPVQKQETNVKPTQQRQNSPALDEKTQTWHRENPWFGSDDGMTGFALGYHNQLLKSGTKLGSDEYYEKLNARMRKVFPDSFDDGVDSELTQKQEGKRTTASPTVVASATRSTASNKIVLTKSQVDIAKRLGVPLADYAKQVAELRKQNNG